MDRFCEQYSHHITSIVRYICVLLWPILQPYLGELCDLIRLVGQHHIDEYGFIASEALCENVRAFRRLS